MSWTEQGHQGGAEFDAKLMLQVSIPGMTSEWRGFMSSLHVPTLFPPQ